MLTTAKPREANLELKVPERVNLWGDEFPLVSPPVRLRLKVEAPVGLHMLIGPYGLLDPVA